jgi:hypothetical protein
MGAVSALAGASIEVGGCAADERTLLVTLVGRFVPLFSLVHRSVPRIFGARFNEGKRWQIERGGGVL